MRRNPRIDRLIDRPELRARFEVFRHHFAVAAGQVGSGNDKRHEAALERARKVGWDIVAAIVGEPENGNLPPEEVFRYLKNVAMQEMLAERAKKDRIILSELVVRFPPGRPPTRRPSRRQQLIDELRADPGMSDRRLAARARDLRVWTHDQAADPASTKKRISRLRQDAARAN